MELKTADLITKAEVRISYGKTFLIICTKKENESTPHTFDDQLFEGYKDITFYRDIRVFHDKEIWRISVRLSDRSEITQNKLNLVKNCPQWGLNSQPPDHEPNAVLTVLGRNLLKFSEVSFLLFHAPLHMLHFVYFYNQ